MNTKKIVLIMLFYVGFLFAADLDGGLIMHSRKWVAWSQEQGFINSNGERITLTSLTKEFFYKTTNFSSFEQPPHYVYIIARINELGAYALYDVPYYVKLSNEQYDSFLSQNPDIMQLKTGIERMNEAGCLSNRIGEIIVSKIIDFSVYKKTKTFSNDDNVLKSILSDISFNTIPNKTDNVFTIIYLPAGTYSFNEPINLTANNVILKGAGTSYSGEKTLLRFNYGNMIWTGSNIYVSGNHIGIEDLEIESNGAQGSHQDGGYFISISNSTECWIRSIYSNNPISSHVSISSSSYIEIRDSYFNECISAMDHGNGYGITLGGGAEKCLLENNIFRKLRHSIILGNEAKYNVATFNYSRESKNDEAGGFLLADICFHGHSGNPSGKGPSFNLMENNIAQFVNFDVYWGGSEFGNIILNNRISDDIRIGHTSTSFNEYDDENKKQIIHQNFCDDWGIWDDQVWDARNNKVNLFTTNVWELEHDSQFDLKTLYYRNKTKPQFMNDFIWPFISWDHNTNNAKRRYENDSYPRVALVGFSNYEYNNLELISDDLEGTYSSTGNVTVKNSIVRANKELRLRAYEKITFLPEFKTEASSKLNASIKKFETYGGIFDVTWVHPPDEPNYYIEFNVDWAYYKPSSTPLSFRVILQDDAQHIGGPILYSRDILNTGSVVGHFNTHLEWYQGTISCEIMDKETGEIFTIIKRGFDKK